MHLFLGLSPWNEYPYCFIQSTYMGGYHEDVTSPLRFICVGVIHILVNFHSIGCVMWRCVPPILHFIILFISNVHCQHLSSIHVWYHVTFHVLTTCACVMHYHCVVFVCFQKTCWLCFTCFFHVGFQALHFIQQINLSDHPPHLISNIFNQMALISNKRGG